MAGLALVSGAVLGAAAGNTDWMIWARVSVGFGAAAAGGAFDATGVSAGVGVAATVVPLPPLGAGVAAAAVAGATPACGASGAGLSTRRRQRESI